MQKLLSFIMILLAGSGSLPAQQNYTYVVDEEFNHYENIYLQVEGLLWNDNDQIIVSAEFHPSSGHAQLIRLNADGTHDNSFGFSHPSAGGGGGVYAVPEGYMRFNFAPGKFTLGGMPFPGYNFYYSNNFPTNPPPDAMALFPLPDGRFYVSGRIYLDSLGNKAHLVRMMPNGSVDTTFTPRIVNAPLSGKTSHMMFYDEERVMVGGNFNTFEEHVSPHMVRVFLDGSIDTTFTSEFVERYFTSARYVDEAGRIMITDPYGGFSSHPEDTVLVMRVLPDGREDTSFHHLEIKGGTTDQNSYWWPAVIGVVPEDDGGYIIYGGFTEIDGHPRNGIAKIDSTGHLDLMAFANQSGAEIVYDAHSWIVPWDWPRVNIAIRTPDGGLLVGGMFTHFDGVPHYNLVKLKKVLQYTSVEENSATELLVFPNPANTEVTFRCESCHSRSTLRIFDINGRQMQSFTLGENYEGQVLWDTREAKPGMYFYQLWQNDEQVHSGKIVVQH